MPSDQTILVNGKPQTVPVAYPLTALLASMQIDAETARGIAVAINDEVVRRTLWGEVVLQPADSVEIVTAQQGG